MYIYTHIYACVYIYILYVRYMVVSTNGGATKWMVYNGKSY